MPLRAALLMLAAVALTSTYFAIEMSCPYGIVATAMTGFVKIPGMAAWLAYKRILALAVALGLYAIYLWLRGARNDATRRPSSGWPVLLAAAGVAAIGFLFVIYPCPVPITLLMLLDFDVALGDVIVPYWAVLVLAAGLVLYAIYQRRRQLQTSS